MRLTGFAGLVYAVFGVVFVIALPFVFHYWQEQKRPRTGQIKKRRLRQIMRRWIWVALIACIIGLVGAAIYYLAPNATVVALPPRGKAYVIVRDCKIEPLVAGTAPVLEVIFENTGSVEAIGYFRDVSCKFVDFEPRFLTYARNDDCGTFKLAPSERNVFRWPFESVILDDWKLKMLNENKAKLYLFGKGEYSDETGRKYTISFCREYNTVVPNNLVFCSEGITFREPEQANQ